MSTEVKPTFLRAGMTFDEMAACTATPADYAIVDAYREALALLVETAEHFAEVAVKHRLAMTAEQVDIEERSNIGNIDRLRRALATALGKEE